MQTHKQEKTKTKKTLTTRNQTSDLPAVRQTYQPFQSTF